MERTWRCALGLVVAVTMTCACLAAEDGGKLRSLDQLKTEKIAVQRGSVGQTLAQELLGDSVKSNLITYEKIVDVIQALKDGKVRAVIMGDIPAQPFIREEGNGLAIMPEPLYSAPIAIGIKKGNKALVDDIDSVLIPMKEDGTIQGIIDRYFADPYAAKAKDIDFNVGAPGGKLVMGTDMGFPPFEFHVEDGPVGIDVEIMALIAQKLGKELVISEMAFDALPIALASGKVDLICAGYTATEERKQNVDFTVPYMEVKQIALVRADDCEASSD